MLKKKKILFRMNTLRGGGAEKVLITILKYIDYEKYEIDLLVNKKGYVYDDQVPEQVNFKFLFYASSALKKSMFNVFYKLVREIGLSLFNHFPPLLYKLGVLSNYNVEIAFLEDLVPFVAKSPNKNSKKIAWIHIDLYQYKSLSNQQKKRICKALFRYDKIVVVSDQAATSLLKLMSHYKIETQLIKPKIITVYNPIDFEHILENSIVKSSSLKEGNKKIIISVGTLNSQKRYDRLILAIDKLIKERFDVKLVILGDGPLKKDLVALIGKLKLEKSVVLMGFTPNPYTLIKQADLFVMSSDYEGYGLVLVEAMLLAKPIVSTNVTGASEVLQNGKYGMLVEKNVQGLFNGIRILLTSKEMTNLYIKKSEEGAKSIKKYDGILEVEKVLDSL